MALQSTVTVNKPNFLSVGFCLKILVELGGKATRKELRAHAKERYGLTDTELKILFNLRLRSLQRDRLVEAKLVSKTYHQDFCYYIVEENKPYVYKVINQE